MDYKHSQENTKKRSLSCAECRRLKLKCNRIWPCTSCAKRGLAELCPQGSLATRPRLRPPPPTQQHFIQRIYELQSRINELETALASLQASVSTKPHPLLAGRQVPYLHRKLMRKTALEKVQGEETNSDAVGMADTNAEPHPSEPEDVIDAMGTLSIAPDGKSRFFGPTAVSEGLTTGIDLSASETAQTSLPVDIVAIAQAFPFSTLTEVSSEVHERIKSYLPPIDRAGVLCECYFSYASFVAYPVPQDEWFEDLFYRLYGTGWSSRRSPDLRHQDDSALQRQWHHVPPDELSMFFSVLALGALTDLSTEAFSVEAEVYYQLSRALLTRETVLTEPTLASIQALFLGSYYEGMRSQGNSSRDCWIMMALASKTAHIIGLHRDNSMFGLDEREVQRRRLIFWEVHSMDLIESLAFGRPVCLTYNQTDTKMPIDIHAATNSAGETEESFYSWKFRFCLEVLSVICDYVLNVKPPNYASALTADSKLREFNTTYGWSARHTGRMDVNTAAQLQMMLGTRETSMLYIHRVFFAHAVSTEPSHPEKSKYGRSVLTAFESARLIVNGMQSFVRLHPAFAARVWFLWNHLLSASFVLGSIVSRAPTSSLAPYASALLSNTCKILEQASVYGGRAAYMLPIITKLRIKGYHARLEYESRYAAPAKHPSHSHVGDEDDELAIIGGKTRLVVSKPTFLLPPRPLYEPAPPSTLVAHHKSAGEFHDPESAPQPNPDSDPYTQPLYTESAPDVPAAQELWPQGSSGYALGAGANAAELDTHVHMGYPISRSGEADHDPRVTYAPGHDILQEVVQMEESLDIRDNEWQKLMRDLGV